MTVMPSENVSTSPPGELLETSEPPESERLVKLTGENARLRSEIRQAVARAQRAEADANRVRSSTKFQVGDLLVKAARNPRRLFTLPRDVLRLYRLRKHRRTRPPAEETNIEPGRARRSDYSDDLAARLLLPRVSEQPHLPLSIAGALDPLTAAQWRHVAAVTSVLPHDAATLIHDVDPDVVVIDTAASKPFATWSHLGDPAATDRALAVRDLITSAKSRGRPVMLLRSSNDSAGFDFIGGMCDLVVDLPGSPRNKSWQPGLDLGCVSRIDAELLAPASSTAPSAATGSGVLITDPGSSSMQTLRSHLLERDVPTHVIDPARPAVAAVENAIRDSAVVVLTGDQDDDRVGGSLLCLLALATGRALVSADDTDLRRILGLAADAPTRDLGWFIHADHDSAAICATVDEALAAPRIAPAAQWQVWRALFDRASAPSCWADAVTRLGLGAQPLSVRRAAFTVLDRGLSDTDARSLMSLVHQSPGPVREIICDHADARSLRTAHTQLQAASPGEADIRIVAVDLDAPPDHARLRAAQASSCPILLTVAAPGESAFSAALAQVTGADLRDAILSYEIADSPGHVHLHDRFDVHVWNSASVRTGSVPTAIRVQRPGEES